MTQHIISFVDTHCHLNMMVKKDFDRLLTSDEIQKASFIAQETYNKGVKTIINVGTSIPESLNCISLAQAIDFCYAAVGIHPNDATPSWQTDFKELQKMAVNKEQNKIVVIGECGLDFHYPGYDKQRQYDAFKAQIELALTHELALIVHTRDAGQETLQVLEEYKKEINGVIHCFSEQLDFANTVIDWGFVIGIGGTITYPKNEYLRTIVQEVRLDKIILETDAPFLPPQELRGKQNSPSNIPLIAQAIAQLRSTTIEEVGSTTTAAAKQLFKI